MKAFKILGIYFAELQEAWIYFFVLIYFCYISRNFYSQKQSSGGLSRKGNSVKCLKENTYGFSFWAEFQKAYTYIKIVSRVGFFWWVLHSSTEKFYYRKPSNPCICIGMECKTNLLIYVFINFHKRSFISTAFLKYFAKFSGKQV